MQPGTVRIQEKRSESRFSFRPLVRRRERVRKAAACHAYHCHQRKSGMCAALLGYNNRARRVDLGTNGMTPNQEGEVEYKRLPEYASLRYRELAGMVAPYLEVTDHYGELICALVFALGQKAPVDADDEVCRDLLADVFDFLYDGRRAILESQFSVAFPLLRRAFESTSLLAACAVDVALAERWASGKEVPNSEVRKRLCKIGEPLESTREMYRFFSKGSHPNRDMVPVRFLGKSNQFVLGAISKPDLLVFCEHCRQHLSLWFWFCAVASFRYVGLTDCAYGEKYLKTSAAAQTVAGALVDEMKRLRSDPAPK
jgi:hypothetical protein